MPRHGFFVRCFLVALLSCSVQAQTLACGFEHTCALLQTGVVKCWGKNNDGQLGDGSTDDSATPVQVVGISNAVSVAAGGEHTCALLIDGTIKCWGKNAMAQIGDGNQGADVLTPVTVDGISTATAVALGDTHSCAVSADETARCWGDSGRGQLGNGNAGHGGDVERVATEVSDLTEVWHIALGSQYTYAENTDGELFCWGELGSNEDARETNPARINAGATVKHVSVGDGHACAVLYTGSVECWGDNSNGKLGDGTTENRGSPTLVTPGLTTATEVALGGDHSCALLESKTIKCWGRNDKGALGDNSRFDSNAPVDVTRLTGATSVAAGKAHSCAATTTGQVLCWGNNLHGQLGHGSSEELSYVPVNVTGLTIAVAEVTTTASPPPDPLPPAPPLPPGATTASPQPAPSPPPVPSPPLPASLIFGESDYDSSVPRCFSKGNFSVSLAVSLVCASR